MVAGTSRLAALPVALPKASWPADTDLSAVASSFADLFARGRVTDASTFVSDAVWRDTFCLTGTLRTFYGAQGVVRAWRGASSNSARPVGDSLRLRCDETREMALSDGSRWVEVAGDFQVETAEGLSGKCTLMMGVVPAPAPAPAGQGVDVGGGSSWRIWSMRTVLDDIAGWPSVNTLSPGPAPAPAASTSGINGHTHPSTPPPNSAAQSTNTDTDPPSFPAIIIGGGQAGLSVAGRLQALDIPYILIDKYTQTGDNWTTRYDSARLHTSRAYAHLPFDRTFPATEYQEYLTKDDLARGYRTWSTKYGVEPHIWAATELRSGTWDEGAQQWTLRLSRRAQANARGEDVAVRCRFVIMATGAGGQEPYMPSLPGRDAFTGQALHSAQYRSSRAWRGKTGIVVGTANTAHDIADDMDEAALALTTMVQRSKTYVLPAEYWARVSRRTYNEVFATDLADKLQMTGPSAAGRLMAKTTLDGMAREEPERFDALERAGFLVERYGDIFWHLFERGGGHYMDVGTSRKIADGKVSSSTLL